MDSLERAISVYENVTKEFPKSCYSADAFYRIGVIYHEKMDSLKRAQEAFSKVGSEYASSEFAPIALRKGNSLKRLIELRKSAGKDETNEQAAQKRFLSAEIQLTRLGETELALDNYRVVVDSFPETSVAPRAAYAIAWIYGRKLGDKEKALDLYRQVVARFPRSPQARGAVDEIGNLGAEELKTRLDAYVDSAFADTAAAAEELRKRKRAMGDSAVVKAAEAAQGRGGEIAAPVDSLVSEEDVRRRMEAMMAPAVVDTTSLTLEELEKRPHLGARADSISPDTTGARLQELIEAAPDSAADTLSAASSGESTSAADTLGLEETD